MGNTQVHSSFIDQFLVLSFIMISPGELEMLLEAIDGFSYDAFLVIEETQFKESVGLGLLIFLFISYLKKIFEVLYGKMNVSIFGVGFS